ncbi:MAG: putative lipid II flippase FtsW [Puniceicoccales bacterium]|jgi:cell division protein FtsW|nr:putative lipid II flippase FtsW [Puniceicoccales bacterium]
MILEKLEAYYNYFSQRKAGWFILLCTGLLIGLGLIVLSSASLSFIKSENHFYKQLLWCVLGVPLFLIGCFVDLKFLKKHCSWILTFFAVALVIVLIPGIGKMVNGSRRWIAVGGFNVQVSEFAKVAVILWLAQYLNNSESNRSSFRIGFLIPLLVVASVCGLIFLEPDYGTAMLIGAVTITLLFLAGARLLYIWLAISGGLLAISILIYLNPTRMGRIVAFLDVENNKLAGAYQLWQGMLGFASGGLYGKGLGQGRQQLVYLPEAHTDFIFPIFSEELGSLAAISVLAIYLTLFLTVAHSAKKLLSNFTKFLSYGIALTIIYQVIINVGVVTGLFPTKGMGLPFISYGGSNLVLLSFMVGLLLNCFSEGQREWDCRNSNEGQLRKSTKSRFSNSFSR